MKKLGQWSAAIAAAAILLCVLALLMSPHAIARGGADAEGKPAAARYTVVETQGHNMPVTNNSANMLYFYTADKDQPVGSPLKLRASLDLTKVGGPELTIKDHGLEK